MVFLNHRRKYILLISLWIQSVAINADCSDLDPSATVLHVCENVRTSNKARIIIDNTYAPNGSVECICELMSSDKKHIKDKEDQGQTSVNATFIDHGSPLNGIVFDVGGKQMDNLKAKEKLTFSRNSTLLIKYRHLQQFGHDGHCLEILGVKNTDRFDASCFDQTRSHEWSSPSNPLVPGGEKKLATESVTMIPIVTALPEPALDFNSETQNIGKSAVKESANGDKHQYLVPLLSAFGGAVLVVIVAVAFLIPTIRRFNRLKQELRSRRYGDQETVEDMHRPRNAAIRNIEQGSPKLQIHTNYSQPPDVVNSTRSSINEYATLLDLEIEDPRVKPDPCHYYKEPFDALSHSDIPLTRLKFDDDDCVSKNYEKLKTNKTRRCSSENEFNENEELSDNYVGKGKNIKLKFHNKTPFEGNNDNIYDHTADKNECVSPNIYDRCTDARKDQLNGEYDKVK